MSEPIRYSNVGNIHQMIVSKEGDFVRWEDYELIRKNGDELDAVLRLMGVTDDYGPRKAWHAAKEGKQS